MGGALIYGALEILSEYSEYDPMLAKARIASYAANSSNATLKRLEPHA